MIKDPGETKLVSLGRAAQLALAYKKEGKRVGCLSGSFDLLTARHYRSLYECARLCDVLIVLLNSDTSISAYKGPGKPFFKENERVYLLSQSASVAHVVIFNELTPVDALEKIQPTLYFNTAQWGADCIERTVVERHGGHIKAFDITLKEGWVHSSSEVVQKIRTGAMDQVARAVFLDRDGVINENKEGYTHRWKDFTFLPHVVPSLKKLKRAGYELIVVTNQSGVGRGYYSERAVQKLHQQMKTYLTDHGVIIDAVYYCPHTEKDGCACRKPQPGMLLKAARDRKLNLSKSWFIGDSGSDVDAGRLANVQTILIDKGTSDSLGSFRPSVNVENIKEAVEHILRKEK
jgi:rfaE bifunctional protein nucleotidyltransferase chain/domain